MWQTVHSFCPFLLSIPFVHSFCPFLSEAVHSFCPFLSEAVHKRSRPFLLSILVTILAFILSACHQDALEDFKAEAKPVILNLIYELKSIRTRDDLVDAKDNLELSFLALADIMLRAEKIKNIRPEKLTESESEKESYISNELRVEINRILYMEGGREVLEKSQEKALILLEKGF